MADKFQLLYRDIRPALCSLEILFWKTMRCWRNSGPLAPLPRCPCGLTSRECVTIVKRWSFLSKAFFLDLQSYLEAASHPRTCILFVISGCLGLVYWRVRAYFGCKGLAFLGTHFFLKCTCSVHSGTWVSAAHKLHFILVTSKQPLSWGRGQKCAGTKLGDNMMHLINIYFSYRTPTRWKVCAYLLSPDMLNNHQCLSVCAENENLPWSYAVATFKVLLVFFYACYQPHHLGMYLFCCNKEGFQNLMPVLEKEYELCHMVNSATADCHGQGDENAFGIGSISLSSNVPFLIFCPYTACGCKCLFWQLLVYWRMPVVVSGSFGAWEKQTNWTVLNWYWAVACATRRLPRHAATAWQRKSSWCCLQTPVSRDYERRKGSMLREQDSFSPLEFFSRLHPLSFPSGLRPAT